MGHPRRHRRTKALHRSGNGVPRTPSLFEKAERGTGGPGHPAPIPRSPRAASSPLPRIEIGDVHLRDLTSSALVALAGANDPPVIFRRAGGLARVVRDEKGRPIIEHLRESALRGHIERSADFIRVAKGRSGERTETPVLPPREVVQDVLSLGEWGFPPLDAVTEVPVLRPDGSVLMEPGYDPATCLYYVPQPGLLVPPVAPYPSLDEVGAALELVLEPICDFPFADDASRTAAVACLLTSVVRPAIDGPTPLAALDAPQAGTSKTLLSELLATVSTGRRAAMFAAPQTDDEWRKRITSALLSGGTVVVIDNVEGDLRSASLAAVLTATTWGDRVLGRTETIHLPQRATWVATGNNITLGGDLPRRCYWVRLDAKEPRPWQRRGFRHPDLIAWASASRGRLVGALLTLARNWWAEACPEPTCPGLGSYEGWRRTVGGILELAGMGDFLSNLPQLYEQADVEAEEWGAFLKAWWRWSSPNLNDVASPSRVGEIIAAIERGQLGVDLPVDCTDVRSGRPNSKRMGWAFRKRDRRRYLVAEPGDPGAPCEHEYWIQRAGEERTVQLWRVCRA